MCDASSGSLSSYAYIILLLHYLQQVKPPVIPVLQQVSFDTACVCVHKCVCVCVNCLPQNSGHVKLKQNTNHIINKEFYQ